MSSVVMWAYTLISRLPRRSPSHHLQGAGRHPGRGRIAIGGSIVVLYSALGGMWSITLTDIAQFVIKTSVSC